jgi:hypothetical protein
MSDHERGAYTPPTDAPLAFEPRQPVRGARPFPLALIVSVLVLFGLAAAIFVFYRSGVRQAGEGPQAVGAPVGGLKSAPAAEAQPQDPAAGLEIYRSEPGQPPEMVPKQPQFTPAPEQPQARPVGPPVVLAPAQAPAPQTPPSQAAPSQTQSAQPPTAQPDLRPAQAALPAAPPKAAPPAVVTPPPKPAAPAAKPVAEKTAAEKAALARAKAILLDKPAAPAPAKAGAAAVQIGAVASPSLADKTWNDAVALAPGLAAGKGKGVEKVEKDGKTLYRTSVTGFASRDAAATFCAKLKAAGKACFVK